MPLLCLKHTSLFKLVSFSWAHFLKFHKVNISRKSLLLKCLLDSKIPTNNFASAGLDVHQFSQLELFSFFTYLLIKRRLKYIFIPLPSISNSGKLSETCIRACYEKQFFTELRMCLKLRLNRKRSWTFKITQYIH